jgi:hypothetical protein
MDGGREAGLPAAAAPLCVRRGRDPSKLFLVLAPREGNLGKEDRPLSREGKPGPEVADDLGDTEKVDLHCKNCTRRSPAQLLLAILIFGDLYLCPPATGWIHVHPLFVTAATAVRSVVSGVADSLRTVWPHQDFSSLAFLATVVFLPAYFVLPFTALAHKAEGQFSGWKKCLAAAIWISALGAICWALL